MGNTQPTNKTGKSATTQVRVIVLVKGRGLNEFVEPRECKAIGNSLFDWAFVGEDSEANLRGGFSCFEAPHVRSV